MSRFSGRQGTVIAADFARELLDEAEQSGPPIAFYQYDFVDGDIRLVHVAGPKNLDGADIYRG